MVKKSYRYKTVIIGYVAEVEAILNAPPLIYAHEVFIQFRLLFKTL